MNQNMDFIETFPRLCLGLTGVHFVRKRKLSHAIAPQLDVALRVLLTSFTLLAPIKNGTMFRKQNCLRDARLLAHKN